MGAILVYLAEAAVCMLALYAVQRGLLANEKRHRLNRVLWLLSGPVALVLPLLAPAVGALLYADIAPQAAPVAACAMDTAPVLEAAAYRHADVVYPAASGGVIVLAVKILSALYLAGAVCCLGAMAFRYAALARLLGAGAVLSPEQSRLLAECTRLVGMRRSPRLLVHDRELPPLSWMRFVVVGRDDLARDGREILIHELAHCKAGHSFDLLFADLVCAALWFCPAAWLAKAALAQVHEYQADEAVLRSGVDARRYQLLLVRKAVGQPLFTMANAFNHSTLKSRIVMMSIHCSSKWAWARCLVALPLLFVVLASFAAPGVARALELVSRQSVFSVSDIDNGHSVFADFSADIDSKPVVTDVSVPLPRPSRMPSFAADGAADFNQWLSRRVKYPAEAGDAQGRVTITFVVDAEGSLRDAKVVRNETGSEACAAEALRVVSSSPRWTPGLGDDGQPVATAMAIPVVFRRGGGPAGR